MEILTFPEIFQTRGNSLFFLNVSGARTFPYIMILLKSWHFERLVTIFLKRSDSGYNFRFRLLIVNDSVTSRMLLTSCSRVAGLSKMVRASSPLATPPSVPLSLTTMVNLLASVSRSCQKALGIRRWPDRDDSPIASLTYSLWYIAAIAPIDLARLQRRIVPKVDTLRIPKVDSIRVSEVDLKIFMNVRT